MGSSITVHAVFRQEKQTFVAPPRGPLQAIARRMSGAPRRAR